ncbi:MAG TPA: S8 family serine peptidase, partial [Bacteroidota bacterium]
QRRARVLPANSLVDETDLPVSAEYIAKVTPIVTSIRQTSKWLNGVSAEATPAQISRLEALPFVREIEIVQRYRRVRETEINAAASPYLPVRKGDGTGALDYGSSLAQVSLENIPAVHATGNSAQGIIIGVFDNGFRLLNHEAFDFLRPRIIAQHDFVDHKVSVVPNNPNGPFGGHGVNTLSTLAGYKPGQVIGPAYGASFILARTENDSSETPVEEDNWVAAIQWAESLGVQITSTSLGYYDFDSGFTSLTWQDMNGKTAVITRAAVMAARKGVIVVNSAGNDAVLRSGLPNTLIAPADADSILTAGAVTPFGVRAGFSSYGPTSDGRVKPDVMAVGTNIQAADAYDPTGYTYGSTGGTSFSCPLTAGVAALVLNAHPEATAMQIINAIKTTARQAPSQAARPDNFYGWGIIDALAAINSLGSGSPPPTALAGSNTSTTGFTANWTAVTGATRYRLDVATDIAFSSFVSGYYYLNVGNVTSYAVVGLTPGTVYYYRVRAVGATGTSGSPNIMTVSTVAETFKLSANYPNPFNPGTRIEFQTPEQSRVNLSVFDILGKPVKTLVEGAFPPSRGTPYFVLWDGTDASGARVASGVYFYRMKATGVSGTSSSQIMKMMLIR